MKKYLRYIDKKVIVNSVEEAETFINSLHNNNDESARRVEVNDNVHRCLMSIFTNENAGKKMQTTGMSDGFIYCYPALAATPEECEAAIIAREKEQEAQRKEEERLERERRDAEREARKRELESTPRGFYYVEITYHALEGPAMRPHFRTEIFDNVIADNGFDAYVRVVEFLREGDFILSDYDDITEAYIKRLG